MARNHSLRRSCAYFSWIALQHCWASQAGPSRPSTSTSFLTPPAAQCSREWCCSLTPIVQIARDNASSRTDLLHLPGWSSRQGLKPSPFPPFYLRPNRARSLSRIHTLKSHRNVRVRDLKISMLTAAGQTGACAIDPISSRDTCGMMCRSNLSYSLPLAALLSRPRGAGRQFELPRAQVEPWFPSVPQREHRRKCPALRGVKEPQLNPKTPIHEGAKRAWWPPEG